MRLQFLVAATFMMGLAILILALGGKPLVQESLIAGGTALAFKFGGLALPEKPADNPEDFSGPGHPVQ